MFRDAIVCLFLTALLASAAELPYATTDFADWQATGKAERSQLAPQQSSSSLVIRQWDDADQPSHWLSPSFANPGQPVFVSFWAADNYLKQTDASYAATVDVINLDAAGKESGTSWYLRSVPWDDARKSDLWGQLLPEGLVWKYYTAVYQPTGKSFRLTFHWPKPIVRGECYLADLSVTVATPAQVEAAKPGGKIESAADSRYALEISTPAMGNMFYADAPLRFETFIYTSDDQPTGDLTGAMLRYDVTDFEHFAITNGETPLASAKPFAEPAFLKKYPKRSHNLLLPIMITDNAAKEVGREFFIHIALVMKGKVLAEDTVTYGVVDPRPVAPENYAKSRFSMTYYNEGIHYTDSPHEKQSISVKSGATRMHLIDYYWIRCQPHYPGPIEFKTKLPAFPKIISCPNLEQERSSDEWLKKMAPPECLIPDPLRPGRLTFKIDPYVDYIVAYVRHNRDAIVAVIPSGLERPIDARTIELQRKAYTALKKEWPDLPVGMMLYGLPMNPSADVDLFLENKLYEHADFIDTHVYASSVDWTEWHRLQQAYRKLGRTPPPLISTEFCRVGGSDQVLHSRDTVAAHLDAFANGMHHIYYFNCTNETQRLQQPFLREPTDLGGSQTSGFMYNQRVSRPRLSEAMTVANPAARWNIGNWGGQYGGDTMMPVLQAMTYYNLIQNFDFADYVRTFKPSPNSVAYVFERGDQTICALWLTKPVPMETVVVRGDVPFTVQDLFGRTDRITPAGGAALISVAENPRTFVFDRHVPLGEKQHPGIQVVEGGLTLSPVARGNRGQVAVALPPVFSQPLKLTASGTVDGAWPACEPHPMIIAPGQNASVELPIQITAERATGSYPFSVRLTAGDNLVGLLQAPLQVDELLKLTLDAVPMTFTQAPAVRVVITSLRDSPATGTLTLEAGVRGNDLRVAPVSRPYTVPARGETEVMFPVPRDQVNLTTARHLRVELADTSGIRLSQEAEVAFRATPHTPGKIVIDGKLDDWQLDRQLPIPFARKFTGWGKAWKGPADQSGHFYTLWDDDYLYFAAVITDDLPVTRANDVDIWQDDNIMLGLYPWGWRLGEPLNSGYYREHLGLCEDGQARIFRVGNVASGPTTAEGAKIAVTRTMTGYIYEWAYPRASLSPIRLAPGARFRLSLFAWDADTVPGAKGTYSKLGGIQFGGFNANIDARPEKWREFILTP